MPPGNKKILGIGQLNPPQTPLSHFFLNKMVILCRMAFWFYFLNVMSHTYVLKKQNAFFFHFTMCLFFCFHFIKRNFIFKQSCGTVESIKQNCLICYEIMGFWIFK